MAPFHTPPQYQTSSNIRLRDEDMDRYRPPVFLKKKETLHASQISASCFKHPGVSPVGAQDIYLPDSVSKVLSVSESLLKSSGSASCSSSMQSLSVRFPDREYFASAATTEIKSFVSNGDSLSKIKWADLVRGAYVCCCRGQQCLNNWSPSVHECSCSWMNNPLFGFHSALSTPGKNTAHIPTKN